METKVFNSQQHAPSAWNWQEAVPCGKHKCVGQCRTQYCVLASSAACPKTPIVEAAAPEIARHRMEMGR